MSSCAAVRRWEPQLSVAGRVDERRPVAVTVICRLRRCPSPAPMPSQRRSSMLRCTSGCSGHPYRPVTTSTDRRSLALATNRRAMAGRGGKDGQSTTRSSPSINAAVTSAQAAPGRGTTASRVRSIPMSSAATAPSAGEADQRAPTTCARRRGEKGQRQTDVTTTTPVGSRRQWPGR